MQSETQMEPQCQVNSRVKLNRRSVYFSIIVLLLCLIRQRTATKATFRFTRKSISPRSQLADRGAKCRATRPSSLSSLRLTDPMSPNVSRRWMMHWVAEIGGLTLYRAKSVRIIIRSWATNRLLYLMIRSENRTIPSPYLDLAVNKHTYIRHQQITLLLLHHLYNFRVTPTFLEEHAHLNWASACRGWSNQRCTSLASSTRKPTSQQKMKACTFGKDVV